MYVFLDGHKYSLGATGYYMAFDGSEVWVTLSGRKVKAYRFWGQEPVRETLVDLSSYFTGDAYYIARGPNSIYVFETANTPVGYTEKFIASFVEISTITKEVTRHITLPLTAHCFPVYAKGKVWFTTEASQEIDTTYNDRQRLFYYDLSTNTWSTPVQIPGNKQFEPRKLAHGAANWVYVTGYNENSVFKFNATSGAFVSQIIVNRKPRALFVNGDRELLVASWNGMVSTVNQTLDTYSNDYSTFNETNSFVDDGTYIWAVTPEMGRTTKSAGSPPTDNFIQMDGDDKDYSIEAFSETQFRQILVTPQYVHDVWDDESETIISKTEPQYVIVLSNSSLFAATNFQDSWDLEEIRPYYINIKATAMIATGPEKYYGETT